MRRAAVAFLAAIPLCLAMVAPVAGQTPLTGQFLVNSTVSGYQFSAAIAMNANGNTVIVWSSQLGSSSTEGIYLQRFDGAGARVGSQTRVDDGLPFTNSKKRDPAVAIDDAGNILVVWAAGIFSFGTQFDYFFDVAHIYGQRFNAAGVPQGPNFLVNTGTNGPQEWPSVAMFASGEAVVTWSGYNDGGLKGIWMQRFDANGTRLGVTGLGCFNYLGSPAICDSPVNTTTAGYQAKPRVAANTGTCAGGPIPGGCTLGDFVVVWEGNGPGDGYGIFGQVFSGDNGLKSGAEFRVNTYTNNTQENASVSMDGNGNFVVVWVGEATVGRGVFGQRFGIPSGPCPVGCAVTFGPLGSEFQVASLVGGSNHFNRASVGKATTGGFVVVWNDVDNNSSNDAIFGRDYDEDGTPLASQFQVSDPSAVYYRPAVAVNPAGQFTVTWEGGNDGGGDFGIWARRFAPAAASDTTPPVITPNISGTLGANGWYTSDVTVTWTVTDPDSSVTSSPCSSSTVTTDTTGVTFTCTATSGGGTNSISVTIKRDASPPSATLAVTTGTLGSNGWYVSDVTISTTGADSVSGPVTCTADQTLTTDTVGQDFAGSCTNAAGLTANAPTLTIKRDVSPPSASLTVTSGTLGSGGWYVSNVTVSTSGTDTVSSPVTCTAPQILTTETSGQVFAGSCTNDAGLTTSASPLTVKLDKSGPTITINTPTDGASYNLNQAVPASYACADALAGIASCTGPVASGANIDTASAGTKTFAVTALDAAGNSLTQSVGYDVVGPVPVDEQLRSLGGLISGLGAPPGTTKSLLAKVAAVQSSVAKGNTTSACNQLGALIHEAQAQSGKKLMVDQADAIIAAAQQLSSTLGCP